MVVHVCVYMNIEIIKSLYLFPCMTPMDLVYILIYTYDVYCYIIYTCIYIYYLFYVILCSAHIIRYIFVFIYVHTMLNECMNKYTMFVCILTSYRCYSVYIQLVPLCTLYWTLNKYYYYYYTWLSYRFVNLFYYT